MDGLVLVAAGASTRFGAERSKVLSPLAGRPMLAWSLEAFREAVPALAVVVVAREEDLDAVRAVAGEARVVPGGAERQDSAELGLAALPPETEVVLVHDAARPLVTADLVRRVLEAARRDGAALAATAVTDTVHKAEGAHGAQFRLGSTLDRSGLLAAQTPQAARADLLRRAYAKAREEGLAATDEAGLLLAAEVPVTAVEGERWNLKVTVAEDLEVAEAILRSRSVRRRP
jgi:2-C-methyl-D-erythritol 4-phosphate cytidylyltransferase